MFHIAETSCIIRDSFQMLCEYISKQRLDNAEFFEEDSSTFLMLINYETTLISYIICTYFTMSSKLDYNTVNFVLKSRIV